MGFEVKRPRKVHEDTFEQPIQEEEQEQEFVEEQEHIPPAQQQYNLARDRARRQIRPPYRYAHADIVSFALSVAKDIES